MSTTDRINVGVVGCGKMGLLHASILNVLPEVKLQVFCEKDKRIRKYVRKLLPGIQCVEHVDEMHDLDAVFVTVPIPVHYHVIRAIVDRKIANNIFTEKTLASNFKESSDLCQITKIANRNSVKMVGYHNRFGVTFNKTKSLLDEEVLGEIESFEAYAYSEDFLGSNSPASKARGGVLRDLGSHCLDMAMWYFGDLSANTNLTSSGLSQNDCVELSLKSSKGIEGRFSISWMKKGYHKPEIGFTIYGSKGFLKVNDDFLSLEYKDGTSQRWFRQSLGDNVPFLLAEPEYYREDECFVKLIREPSAKTNMCDFFSASKVDRVIDLSSSELTIC
jgi:predicted dehydrogenase